ncbi:hypothetical protein [Isoptericola haloaureus]|uniref:Uncharacterized protein n=1 Tax=Isoptericola haloaureus TaxID=1542902 RepID=A0ABU7Z5E9_9MICO
MSTPTFDTADVLAALERMNSDQRAEWVALVKNACVNLSNAEYAFAGDVPDAKPDPDAWAADSFWLGTYQLGRAVDQITPDPNAGRTQPWPTPAPYDANGPRSSKMSATPCAATASSRVDFGPRLVLTSPEKRSGKTRCLEMIHQLAHKPPSTANASTAAL